MKTILVMVDHYLPGYKSGGPVRAIANLVTALGSEFRFRILTRDRDLGDMGPYPGVIQDEWQRVGEAEVMYLSPSRSGLSTCRSIINSSSADLLYLNSIFDSLTIKTLFLRRLSLLGGIPVILAPRGEFSPNAFRLKRWKKGPYIALTQALALYNNLTWQATAEPEQRYILARFGPDIQSGCSRLVVAPDIAAIGSLHEIGARSQKEPGRAQVVFLSRISRMKNLDFALQALGDVSGDITFDIYGPLEDRTYWKQCERQLKRLPESVRTEYHGAIPADQVMEVLSKSHLLLLPTLGENYGHVIVEALSAGCPILISDRTPWRGLSQMKAGWDLPLDQPERFREALAAVVAMNAEEFEQWSRGARSFARDHQAGQATVDAYRSLFTRLIEGH